MKANIIKWIALALFLFSALVIILAFQPWFQCWFNNHFGNLNTTLNGLVGPFIGLTSALLVFLSFMMQVDANKKLETRNEHLLKFEKIRFSNDATKNINERIENFKSKYDIDNVDWLDQRRRDNLKSEQIISQIDRLKQITNRENLDFYNELSVVNSNLTHSVKGHMDFIGFLSNVYVTLSKYDLMIYSFDRTQILIKIEKILDELHIISLTYQYHIEELNKLVAEVGKNNLRNTTDYADHRINKFQNLVTDIFQWLHTNEDDKIDNKS